MAVEQWRGYWGGNAGGYPNDRLPPTFCGFQKVGQPIFVPMLKVNFC